MLILHERSGPRSVSDFRHLTSLDATVSLFVWMFQSHILRALHYVPAILAGQRRLMNQLHRRLDRAEALALTIGQAKNKKGPNCCC